MSTYQLSTPSGEVTVTLTESGEGRPVLLLHGGAGPDSVAGFAGQLAARFPYRVLVPVHPGFGGTPRPPELDSVRGLAEVYRALLVELDLTDVIVAGNSIGGWIASELALAAPDRVGSLVLIDAVGVTSAEHPVVDFYSLDFAQIAKLSWANPEGHVIDLSALSDAQRAIAAGNRAALQVYAGAMMTDPGLAGRLAGITVPTLVVWGEADGIVTPAYGQEYAAAIPGAAFSLVPQAGHLPHLENPEAVLALFADRP
jgi:pimeloyl-ACP methyl ester carboxylesterase